MKDMGRFWEHLMSPITAIGCMATDVDFHQFVSKTQMLNYPLLAVNYTYSSRTI